VFPEPSSRLLDVTLADRIRDALEQAEAAHGPIHAVGRPALIADLECWIIYDR